MTELPIAEFWEHAPCGHIIMDTRGHIVRVNATVTKWLGYTDSVLRGRLFSDLLTAGGRIHYSTHFEPLLSISGELNGLTLDLVASDGRRLPMFVTANVKTGADGRPELMCITAVDATDRRAFERELLEQRRRAETEHARVRRFAETLRRSLLPPVLSPPDGLDAADYFYTASVDDVGGDFYDLFPLSRTKWGFFLGDVVGKGVDAALVTALTRYSLRALAVLDEDPVRVLHNLNSVLGAEFGPEGDRFSTIIYGSLERRGDGFEVVLASGGHPPPLLFYADGSAYYADTIGGQPVGISVEPHFVAVELSLRLGDTLVLYTDGLTEASTGVGQERYDDHGALLRFAKAHSPTTAQGIVDAVHGLLDSLGTGVKDDAAVLALGVPSVMPAAVVPSAS